MGAVQSNRLNQPEGRAAENQEAFTETGETILILSSQETEASLTLTIISWFPRLASQQAEASLTLTIMRGVTFGGWRYKRRKRP